MLFIKTMRVISQLYKGPIVQDKEIMISSHLRLHIGKELHSHQGHIHSQEDRTLSKEEPCHCPALVPVEAFASWALTPRSPVTPGVAPTGS